MNRAARRAQASAARKAKLDRATLATTYGPTFSAEINRHAGEPEEGMTKIGFSGANGEERNERLL